MKTPLIYQMTAYDCGPTSVINAFRQLFDRKELPPDKSVPRRHQHACLPLPA